LYVLFYVCFHLIFIFSPDSSGNPFFGLPCSVSGREMQKNIATDSGK
jgi:hypothetical protein